MTARAPESPFVFKIHDFSGPLDLLLRLVKENKMDLLQINVCKITDQYMAYLKSLSQPDLNRAGDFIRMASWLLYLKSKSLLPEDNLSEEEPDLKERQEELSSLLILYEKFQKYAAFLNDKKILGRDLWKSGQRFLFEEPEEDKKIEIGAEQGLFQLSQAYSKKLLAKKREKSYEVKQAMPTLIHRLRETAGFFRVGLKLKFSRLVLINKSPHSVLLSFLSLLELSKSGLIRLFQECLFSNIDIKVRKNLEEEDLKILSEELTENPNKDLGDDNIVR